MSYSGGLILLGLLLCSCCSADGTIPMTVGEDGWTPWNLNRSDYEGVIHELESPMEDCTIPWSCCDQKSDILPHGILKCGKSKTLYVLKSFCATFNEENNVLEAGHCLYNYKHTVYTGLMRNISAQSSNMYACAELYRTGTLCGRCQNGYYPLAYSYDMNCVQCHNGKSNWWKFALTAFLPLTIFYIVITFFKINVISSNFQGFLFYSQMISWPALIRVLLLVAKTYKSKSRATAIAIRCLVTFYGIWNLDFFRSLNFHICLGTDMLQTLALDLIVGVYPLLLIVVSYVLIELYDRNFRPLVIVLKPFHKLFSLFRENWDLRTSLIDAFATTYLLTNVKFQSVSFDLLTPVYVYHLNATGNLNRSLRLFYDASVPYFGSRHLPYGIIALLLLLLFAILPVLLLVLYPLACFQKLLNLFPIRWYILHTFVDSFYGSYKDGTQPGTRDCRWFASLFIIAHFCTMFVGACVQDEVFIYLHFSAMILIIVAILFFSVQPFKENASHFTNINAFFALFLALFYTISVVGGIQDRTSSELRLLLQVLSAILPLLYISAIILHWMYSRWRLRTERWLHPRRNKYRRMV